jgi:hypothetical protein
MQENFCDNDSGFDYVFARLSAIYGAAFIRHWDGVEPEIIRQEWQRQLGRFLTYRPSMDFAINLCNPDFPPSALKFREFCNAGPNIPRDELKIEHNPTPIDPAIVAEAKRKFAELRGKL